MLPLTRRGTVYGTLLNHRDALAALGDAVHQPPYKAAPKAPILYIKPRNTWVGPGDAVVVPHDVEELEIGATLGLVIGRVACRVREEGALDHIAGLCDRQRRQRSACVLLPAVAALQGARYLLPDRVVRAAGCDRLSRMT